MNHLPFDWSDAVDDNHVVAHFIGGAWDGKTYAIPKLLEWKIASLPALTPSSFGKKSTPKKHYDVAVYKQVLVSGKEAIYWFTRLEKADE